MTHTSSSMHTHTHTQIKGYPVDYCLEYHGNGDNRRGIGCGQETANLFCREQGLKDCNFYLASYYSHGATFTLGNGEINPADGGGGLGRHTYFTNITCSAIDVIQDDPMKGGNPSEGLSSTSASRLHLNGGKIGTSGIGVRR